LATNQGVVGSIPASRTRFQEARSQDLAFFVCAGGFWQTAILALFQMAKTRYNAGLGRL
jgi:hypothetical protein